MCNCCVMQGDIVNGKWHLIADAAELQSLEGNMWHGADDDSTSREKLCVYVQMLCDAEEHTVAVEWHLIPRAGVSLPMQPAGSHAAATGHPMLTCSWCWCCCGPQGNTVGRIRAWQRTGEGGGEGSRQQQVSVSEWMGTQESRGWQLL